MDSNVDVVPQSSRLEDLSLSWDRTVDANYDGSTEYCSVVKHMTLPRLLLTEEFHYCT